MLQHSSFVNGGAGQSACGDVAQSGERLLFAGGIGSIPVVSTIEPRSGALPLDPAKGPMTSIGAFGNHSNGVKGPTGPLRVWAEPGASLRGA